MKKLFKISFGAVFAVLPTMAMAEGELTAPKTIASKISETGDAFTTQSYVKGAYNAVLDDMKTVNDAVTVLNGNVSTEGSVLNAISTEAAKAAFSGTGTYDAGSIGKALQSALSAASAAETSAGAGLSKSVDGEFSVNVDNTTIEISGEGNGSLGIVDGSIGSTQLSEAVNSSLGLANTALQASDITSGTTSGAIKVGENTVYVHGLSSVATTGAASDITEDSDHKFVTEAQITSWAAAATAVANYSGDLAGKQNAITSESKLDADLVDDSTSTNKFVTASDKESWNAAATQAANNADAIAENDRRLIPVATGWANNNGADTTSTVQLSSLALAAVQS